MSDHVDATATTASPAGRGVYAWVVFTLLFGLMLSEYMSRQVVTAVFPLLEQEWQLSDTQLGSLVGVVGLMVGVLALPISLLVDRYGRAFAVTLMAIAWGGATILGGVAGSFLVLLFARVLLGAAQAAFGSAGGAILLGVFPPRLHSTVMGAFLAAALFGSVLGVALGGVIASHYGWRIAFFVMGATALLLSAAFWLVVGKRGETPSKHRAAASAPRLSVAEVMRALVSAPTAVYVYFGAGMQMFSLGALLGWIPSYLNRYYGLDAGQAGVNAGGLVLISAFGMALGGAVVDRLSRRVPGRRLVIIAIYAATTMAMFGAAFLQGPGPIQLALIAVGIFFSGAHNGPCTAIVTEVNDSRLHATVLATYALATSLLGMAAGPFVVGLVADSRGLQFALLAMPVTSLVACVLFLLARRQYGADARRFAAAPESSLEAIEEQVTLLDFHADEHANSPRASRD